MFNVFPTARLRPSPYFDAVMADGMDTASIYNRMILPASFGDREAEYWRLINGVAMWDVGVERQVQITGKDAAKLVQILTVRDISNCKVGQGKYIPMCDHRGTVINDPIMLKHNDEKFWLSIADSDMWLWAKAIGAERGLDFEVTEPDVSPLAVQGPKAEDVIADIFGDWVRDIKYFWFKETEIEGIPVAVQRSGWSKQGGFEIYLMDGQYGNKLYNLVKEAGQPYGIGPGGPTSAERTESGLLSVGGDTDDLTNPFEVRLGKYVNTDLPDEVVGIKALRKIKEDGPKRHQLGVVLEGGTPDPLKFAWEEISVNGRKIGDMTNCVWSPRMKANIGYALVSSDLQPGTEVAVHREQGIVTGALVDMPFL